MKKLFFAVVLTMFTSMMYAQVPAVNGLKRVQDVLRSMPNVIAGINKVSNISTEVSAAVAASVSNTTKAAQMGTSDQMRTIPTPTPLVNPLMEFPHLVERAVPARPWPTNQDSIDFYRTLARKVQAINDSIDNN